jgi:CDP-diacylglycerol--glycerol-3-phosphate 3-phosphatidyltransferase
MTEVGQKKFPLAMTLTLFRIFLTVPVLLLAYTQDPTLEWVAIFLFIIASITDYYDGYFARKWNQVSNLGKFLDPIADKILVSSLLILFVYQNKVDIWMVLLFITRDTLIGGVRAAAAADHIIIAAHTTGKWKAALQMVSVPFLMTKLEFMGWNLNQTGYFLLWFSVGLSLLSGWQYIQLYVSQRPKL